MTNQDLPPPAFHGFPDEDGCRVNLCFTPHAPRHTGEYATAYYTADQVRALLTPAQPQAPVAWMSYYAGMPPRVDFATTAGALRTRPLVFGDEIPSPAVTDASTQSTYPADVSKTSYEIDTTETLAYDPQDWAEENATVEKLSAILHETAIALKGPEGELQRHSWHDLAELARKLRADTHEVCAVIAESATYRARWARGASDAQPIQPCEIAAAIRKAATP